MRELFRQPDKNIVLGTLKDILSIDYSWGEIDFEMNPMNKMVMCESRSPDDCYDLDIEPDDIEVTDTVTVVWEIG